MVSLGEGRYSVEPSGPRKDRNSSTMTRDADDSADSPQEACCRIGNVDRPATERDAVESTRLDARTEDTMTFENSTDMDWDAEPLATVTHQLLSLWPESDHPDSWVQEQFKTLADGGILGWVIPREFGGSAVTAAELNQGYERLAASCLVTTFVLTQRNGACQRIARADNETVKKELLPKLARGEIFATVGISHLSTSRQHLARPAVTVEFEGDDLILNGIVPWVTGSPHADIVVTGGTCEDDSQVLVAMDTSLDGIEIIPPTLLMAMKGSQTGSLRLNSVKIPRRYLLAGPTPGVMRVATAGGTGSVTTSALALGLAARAHDGLRSESELRPDLVPIVEALEQEKSEISMRIHDALGPVGDQLSAEVTSEIREAANSHVLRSAQAYLAACKGLGFKQGHPAERIVRESMFFLVWSCPQPVVQANLREFACISNGNMC